MVMLMTMMMPRTMVMLMTKMIAPDQVVPNVMCIALYSPPLDSIGNSVRGQQFCKVPTITIIISSSIVIIIIVIVIMIVIIICNNHAQELVDLFNFHRFDNLRHSDKKKLDPRRESFEVFIRFTKSLSRTMQKNGLGEANAPPPPFSLI